MSHVHSRSPPLIKWGPVSCSLERSYVALMPSGEYEHWGRERMASGLNDVVERMKAGRGARLN